MSYLHLVRPSQNYRSNFNIRQRVCAILSTRLESYSSASSSSPHHQPGKAGAGVLFYFSTFELRRRCRCPYTRRFGRMLSRKCTAQCHVDIFVVLQLFAHREKAQENECRQQKGSGLRLLCPGMGRSGNGCARWSC